MIQRGNAMILKILLYSALVLCSAESRQPREEHKMSGTSYESKIAKKSNFPEWRNYVKGPETRFHSAFEFDLPANNWKLINSEVSRLPEEFLLRLVEKHYVSLADPDRRVLISYALCESVRSAHENLFASLTKITNPSFPMQYPNDSKIGDVYFDGLWVRDNLFINVSDLSSNRMSKESFLALNAAIDAKLLEIPVVSAASDQEAPVIRKFALQSKLIPLGETAQVNLAISDRSYPVEKLNLLFSATGGKVSCKAGIYFYTAENIGSNTLDLYVTNPSGKTSKSSVKVTVVE
jgi:hypothetical protein